MTNLNQFFRDAGAALTRSSGVRRAVSQATQQLETKLGKEASRGLERFADTFDAGRPRSAAAIAPAAARAASDGDSVKGLYRELLGRAPDIDGFNAHTAGLARGATRDEVRQTFLNSSAYAENKSAPVISPAEPQAPVAPRENLATRRCAGPCCSRASMVASWPTRRTPR